MPRAARAYEADVLHVPYWAPPLRSSVPIVVTIHDIIPLILPQYRGGPLVRAYTQLVSAAARGATLILTDSDASRSDIMQQLRIPANRVRTIYLAADPEFTDHLDPIDTAALRKKLRSTRRLCAVPRRLRCAQERRDAAAGLHVGAGCAGRELSAGFRGQLARSAR